MGEASSGGIHFRRRDTLGLIAGAGVAASCVCELTATSAWAQNAASDPSGAGMVSKVQQVAPNVYAYLQREAPGGTNLSIANSGFIAGPDHLLAIDALAAPIMAKKMIAAAQKTVPGKPFKRLVLTHHHGDHTGGTQFFSGCEIISHDMCRVMLERMIGSPKPGNWAKRANWADGTETYQLTMPDRTYSRKMTFFDYGDTEVEFFNPGPAHTIGDTLVYLPKQKVLFAGDIGFFKVTPLAISGYVSKWIKVCEMILAMDVDTIVPGHGPVGTKADMAGVRDYLALIQSESKRHYDAGMDAAHAAAAIDLGKFQSWTDADRVATNVFRVYSEFAGTDAADIDRAGLTKTVSDYKALTRGRT